jgi:hypothetical protein
MPDIPDRAKPRPGGVAQEHGMGVSRQLDRALPNLPFDRDPTGTVETDVVPSKKSAWGGSGLQKGQAESET